MGRIGNRAKGSTTYLYTQGSTGSTAVGVDSTDSDKFKIYADPAAGATPETGSQISIDPSTDGDVVVDPNGEGKLQLASGNFDIPITSSSTQGVISVDGTRFIHSRNGAVTGCTFVGQGSGNFTLTGNSNSGFGQNTLPRVSTGQQNTALGNNTLEQLNTGTGNVAIGTGCLNNITTGSNNTYIGRLVSGGGAFNGSNNVVIKAGATLGQVLYSNVESNNVLIQNAGVAAEDNTLRIGTTGVGSGQQSRCFIAGIQGVTPSGTLQTVTINSSGQLGSASAVVTMPWTVVTGATQALAVNNGYVANRGAGVAFTLPATAAVGDRIRVTLMNAGGWSIAQNAGQSIKIGSSDTTIGVGGSLASTANGDTVELLCNVANTNFIVLSSMGNITFV